MSEEARSSAFRVQGGTADDPLYIPLFREFDDAMQTPDIPVAVAAITALTGVLKRSQARTAMQLQTELRLNVEKVSRYLVCLHNFLLCDLLFPVAECQARWRPRIRSIRSCLRAVHAIRHANEQRRARQDA